MSAEAKNKAALDIERNRRAVKYSRPERLRRVIWMVIRPLFRLSPRTAFGYRAWLLRRLGAKVGHDVHVYATATIYFPWNLRIDDFASIGEWALLYNLGPISIGSRATISHRAHLCAGTHDYTNTQLPLEKPPIEVGPQAWVAADAFIGPGITIGEGAVVGARAVVVKDVEPWTVVAGNPARFIKQRVMK